MDNGTFSVDTDALHRQLPFVRELAEHVRSVGTNLDARLSGIGNVWGKQAVGVQFEDQYDNPHHEVLEGLSGAGEVLDSTADGVETMALRFNQLEEDNVAAVRQLQPRDPDSGTSGGDPAGGHSRP